MAITAAQVEEVAARWKLADIAAPVLEQLATYGNLLLSWNQRISLTAIRDEGEVLERHVMEGVFAAAHQPSATSVLDFGSGTGIPGIPIALCRPGSHVTLAESQRRKAAFLQEALRQLQLHATVHAGRAETLPACSFDAVWMRAVDKSSSMLPLAADLVNPEGAICFFGGLETPELPKPGAWTWKTQPLPDSKYRVLHIGRRKPCSTWNT